eukprot:15355210-Ditylum_brightwellii.AAC.1
MKITKGMGMHQKQRLVLLDYPVMVEGEAATNKTGKHITYLVKKCGAQVCKTQPNPLLVPIEDLVEFCVLQQKNISVARTIPDH